MSTWNYRVIRKEHDSGDTTFHIHEVYYDESGTIDGWTMKSVRPMGETESELREDIHYFMSAFRKETLEEIIVEGKPVLQPAYEHQELNNGHYFEAMDRTSVALHYCIEHVGNHPVIRRHPHLKAIFEKAEEALADLYQEAAKLEYERTGD
ncbi:MAG TPA: hypothetical protein DCS21_00175 [Gammaproteobacteria bacterium]|nr:hypothetical protein [Gammaproteobacteria bacterium]